MANNKKILSIILIGLVSLIATGCSDDNPVVVPQNDGPVVDTAPPAVPAGLAIYYDGDNATISWAVNNTDADLLGYMVTRENNGQTVSLFSEPTLVHSLQDANQLPGESIYRVYAVDLVGNISAVASITLTKEVFRGDDDIQLP